MEILAIMLAMVRAGLFYASKNIQFRLILTGNIHSLADNNSMFDYSGYKPNVLFLETAMSY